MFKGGDHAKNEDSTRQESREHRTTPVKQISPITTLVLSPTSTDSRPITATPSPTLRSMYGAPEFELREEWRSTGELCLMHEFRKAAIRDTGSPDLLYPDARLPAPAGRLPEGPGPRGFASGVRRVPGAHRRETVKTLFCMVMSLRFCADVCLWLACLFKRRSKTSDCALHGIRNRSSITSVRAKVPRSRGRRDSKPNKRRARKGHK